MRVKTWTVSRITFWVSLSESLDDDDVAGCFYRTVTKASELWVKKTGNGCLERSSLLFLWLTLRLLLDDGVTAVASHLVVVFLLLCFFKTAWIPRTFIHEIFWLVIYIFRDKFVRISKMDGLNFSPSLRNPAILTNSCVTSTKETVKFNKAVVEEVSLCTHQPQW